MTSEYIIKTQNVSKKFKKTYAVKDLSLSVRRNTVYGLLGPNGAGKSTLLKMITGIIRPTSGEIQFCGRPWKRKDLSVIGSLIESPPLYENLTAFENLKVRAVLMGIGKNRCYEVLQKMDLADAENKKTSEFSLGMKQRLGIALALLNDPQLLILDEPTNGLDPFGIEEDVYKRQEFHQRPVTAHRKLPYLCKCKTGNLYGGIFHGGRIQPCLHYQRAG